MASGTCVDVAQSRISVASGLRVRGRVAVGPAALVHEARDRLRLFAGVVDATMPRDDAWRFLQLGCHVERLQQQAVLLGAWDRFGHVPGGSPSAWWGELLRICDAHEFYCRSRSMVVRRDSALAFLVRNPELPRSLRFSVHQIGELLAGIDPRGARHPLAPPHRMALHLAASVEMSPRDGRGKGEDVGDTFSALFADSLRLHELTMAAYVDYPVEEGLPA